MVDTVRSLSALQTLLADNTTGDISPQDARDVLVSTYPTQFRNWALGCVYTLSPAASASTGTGFTIPIGGSAFVNTQCLTDGAYPNLSDSFARGGCDSWNNTTAVIRVDLAVPRTIYRLALYGACNSGGGILTPDSITVESSTDDVAWTSRLSLTSLSASTPNGPWTLQHNLSAAVTARYWRVTLVPESGNWIAIGEIELYGFVE